MQPKDFSSKVVKPPVLFPGDGFAALISSPAALARCSNLFTISKNLFFTSRFTARFAKICSPPTASVVSARILVPPSNTIESEKEPIDGFAVIPDHASEPPHSSPIFNSVTLASSISCCLLRSNASLSQISPSSKHAEMDLFPPHIMESTCQPFPFKFAAIPSELSPQPLPKLHPALPFV